jgi:recombination protein RecA
MEEDNSVKKRIRRTVSKIKENANKPIVKDDERVDFISTGSTVLNLAASGKGRDGGWARGRIINIVGDNSTGKSLLCLEACAQVFYNIKKMNSKIYPTPEIVHIVYNNVEGVMDFPVETMYGEEFNQKVEWIQTPIAEEFGKDFQRRVEALNNGEFLLYIIDSIDALVPEAQADRMEQILADKKVDGSYGTEKAKFFSAGFFNHLCGLMKGKDATLICVSQVRERIGISFGEKYYRTGGKALDFYTHQVTWLSQTERLERTSRGEKRTYGIKIKARFKKNKTAKPFREANFTVLLDYGIDDVGSLVDYFYGPKEKEVEWNGEQIKTTDLVQLVDNNPEEFKKLQDLVEKHWMEIEDAIKPERKNRWD